MRKTSAEELISLYLVFVCLALIYFLKPLAQGYDYLIGDTGMFLYPVRFFFAQALRNGDFPLWLPHLFGGIPFLADPSHAVFYPPTWLFFLHLGPGVIWLSLILHLGLAGVGTTLLARESTGASLFACVCAGTIYTFGGYFCFHMGHHMHIMACAWTPWVFWSAFCWLNAPSRRRFAALVLFYSVQFLPGALENSLYMSFGLVFLAFMHAISRRREGLIGVKPAAGLGGAMLLGGLLAAFQLLPSYEMLKYSVRAGGIAWESAGQNSIPPWKPLVELLMPNFWGYYGTTGNKLDGIPASELAGYVGLTSVALACFYGWRERVRFDVKVWVWLSLGALVLSFGKFTPIYRILYMSGLQSVRNPARFIYLANLGIAVLAAGGIQLCLHSARLPERHQRMALTALAAGIISAVGFTFFAEQGFTRLVLTDLAFTLISIACLYMSRVHELPEATGFRPFPWRKVFLFLSIFFPLLVLTRESEFANLNKPDTERLLKQRLFAGRVREELGDQWRVHSHHCLDLRVCKNLEYDLKDISGWEGSLSPSARYYEMVSALSESPDSQKPGRRIQDLLGARFILDNGKLDEMEEAVAFEIGPFRAFMNPDAVPRAYIAHQFEVVEDETALRRMAGPNWNPRLKVLLDAQPEFAGESVATSVEDHVEWIQDGNDVLKVKVSTSAPCLFVLHDSYYPGWRATVDGQPTPILRANYMFRAVALGPGTHEVQFEFRPEIVSAGLSLSGVSLLLLMMVCRPGRRSGWWSWRSAAS
ncbi:MAG: YfhO family protein [Planctomycetota bacterium]|nr:YfhO family protein [Planctomycetota bacterium]MDA1139406.1 YfhO family protein [Planctomycetota bacterium]